MWQNKHILQILAGVAVLATVSAVIIAVILIAYGSQQATPFQKSEDYWNQVHVSEYLAERAI